MKTCTGNGGKSAPEYQIVREANKVAKREDTEARRIRKLIEAQNISNSTLNQPIALFSEGDRKREVDIKAKEESCEIDLTPIYSSFKSAKGTFMLSEVDPFTGTSFLELAEDALKKNLLYSIAIFQGETHFYSYDAEEFRVFMKAHLLKGKDRGPLVCPLSTEVIKNISFYFLDLGEKAWRLGYVASCRIDKLGVLQYENDQQHFVELFFKVNRMQQKSEADEKGLVDKAGDKGNDFYDLGDCFSKNPSIANFKAALLYLKKAAELAHPMAQIKLAEFFLNGPFKDLNSASEWFLKAANQNEPYAQYCLSKLYRLGNEVWKESNPKLAFIWCKKAAI